MKTNVYKIDFKTMIEIISAAKAFYKFYNDSFIEENEKVEELRKFFTSTPEQNYLIIGIDD